MKDQQAKNHEKTTIKGWLIVHNNQSHIKEDIVL